MSITLARLRPARPGDAAAAHRRGMLLANARAVRAEIEDIFLTCAHWNRINPDEEPIDCDPDGGLRRLADLLDAQLLAEQPRPM